MSLFSDFARFAKKSAAAAAGCENIGLRQSIPLPDFLLLNSYSDGGTAEQNRSKLIV